MHLATPGAVLDEGAAPAVAHDGVADGRGRVLSLSETMQRDATVVRALLDVLPA
jgi:hypothetical protein